MFSGRVPDHLVPNALARLLARRRASGARILDLTESNPTRAGFDYPAGLVDALGTPAAAIYDPQPFGLTAAREAVAADLARRGLAAPVDRIALVASTSEAYSILFKTLCDPGDVVLAPRPSYPLIEHLTRLDGICVEPYPLEYDSRWRVDVEALRRSIPPRARAILLVNPNNPTGSFVTRVELGELARLAAGHSLALIGDEVFADYPLDPVEPPASVLEQDVALTFALGGLSKAVGLPQMKLAWIVMAGPEAMTRAARERLEYVCDAYLSVSAGVQHAAGRLLASGAAVRAQIQSRLRANLDALCQAAAPHPACRVLPVEGGWYAVVRIPAVGSEEALALDLLAHDEVLAHPGYFFDFPREAYLIVSLLVRPEEFREGVARLFARVGAA